ncbi:MAG: UbiA prenyltransferase family protein [Reyranellaceae bacterium]
MELSAYLRLARPLDWLKNGFVPLGLLFAEAWHRTPLVIDVALVTAAFCLAASAVYAFNDVADADADARHPRKRHRPVASGAIAPRRALAFAMVLAFAALVIAAAVRAEALGLVGAYLVLNLFYSRLLRRIPFVDVLTIAAGFMLRVLAGTVGVGIPPSGWLLATALALTLFLGFAKRRAEFVSANGDASRASLSAYNRRLLDALTLATAVCAGALYAGFTLDARSIEWHAAPNLWLTAPPALAVLARYTWLAFRAGKGENPARELIGDPWIALFAALWLATTVAVIGGFI